MSSEKKNDPQTFYIISVASRLSGMHAQTLRQYDRLGLVSPIRTEGQGRRYSWEDIELLLIVQGLVNDGINLAGVKEILNLRARVVELEQEVNRVRHRGRDQII